MFIWDFVANPIMDALMDWFYSQIVGFLGAFFAQMGNMGAELFELEWVQAVVLFFSQLGWALYGVSLVVSGFECGIEYISGRGNIQQAALNAIKGFLAVNLLPLFRFAYIRYPLRCKGPLHKVSLEPVQALGILARQFWKIWSLLP